VEGAVGAAAGGAVVVVDGDVLDGVDCAHEHVAKISASANPASTTALEAF